ncbi:MAG: hypothetical protein LUD82_05525 [Clostridiales bacterium]|nr:hypothetical protein [Clostridiales bacterium]MCD8126926.1 hypothetical protein [Clostridiales bacterium]
MKEQNKRRSRVIAVCAAVITLSQVLLYLGTRTLESELKSIFVHPFQAE